MSKITVKEFEANAKAHYFLQPLNDDDISRVIHCTSTYHIWQSLIITNERITQVKKTKIDFLNSQYNSFYMFDCESIDKMLTRFTTITYGLVSLG